MIKRLALSLLATALVTVAVASSAWASEPTTSAHGTIAVSGKLSKPQCAALAKISFDRALQAAHAALPGKVVNGELEAEDGVLQYSFEVLDAHTKQIVEVEIDAGDGHVLNIDRDDND